MKHHVQVISLCHNDPRIIESSLEQAYATKSKDVHWDHLMLDQHWPIRPKHTSSELQRIAKRFGCELLDAGRNLGLARGFNWVLNARPFPRNGGVIGFDPDSWPVTPGWDLALCDVLVCRPGTVWASLYHQHAKMEVHERNKLSGQGVTAGINWESIKLPAMNSVCLISRGWLDDVGGFYEEHPFYGGLEMHMFAKVPKDGWVFLPKFREDPHFFDDQHPRYKDWKWRSHHSSQETRVKGSFEEFLKREEPELLNG